MATSRLRRKLERDGVPEHANLTESFCKLMQYGTPLPSLTDHKRDKNEFKPIWQQEVYDERGRRRFHGAFTGGWSAGYFNTVGSKEGWTPSSFRSSRSARSDAQPKSRPEDFMDEEDLAEWRADRPMQVTEAYAGPSSAAPADPLLEALAPPPSADTLAPGSASVHMGQQLLQKMGWKPGQGIGPLMTFERRTQIIQLLTQLHLAPSHMPGEAPASARSLKCPPPDTHTPTLPPRSDRQGLGFVGESRSKELQDALARFHARSPPHVGATGLDSDDEDHVYATGPSIHESTLARPPTETLVLSEGRADAPDTSTTQATWHDGRPLPAGFVRSPEMLPSEPQWPAPPVPSDWRPDPRRVWDAHRTEAKQPVRPATAADRGAILGEAQHPGPPPAISQFLHAKAQARLKANAGPDHSLDVHSIDAETARRALAAFRPPGADPAKEARYRAYLECYEKGTAYAPDTPGLSLAEAQQELDEFFESASRHRPVHGDMAARFTTSTIVQESLPVAGGLQSAAALRAAAAEAAPTKTAAPAPALTAAQAAARNETFGAQTRNVVPFYPPRLLCKRLNVPNPHPDGPEREAPAGDVDGPLPAQNPSGSDDAASEYVFAKPSEEQVSAMERELQEARPPMDLFKAVFESDDDDEADASEPTQKLHTAFTKRKAPAPAKKKKAKRGGPLTFDLE
ncbi:hypothetical protein MCAP1_003206 [Malassezia caprae]|uniref:G-patch domain-containing protein n=1 Tax=Malassezia caprae TaxID=1381934 RepID=A0AAF0EA72_9BASI|nr:hypothetical protein MCAP1_003206 [Malassezia caprae]